MLYLIFSDEAGTWSNREEDYYVRTWISISLEEYVKLQKKFFIYKKLQEQKKLNGVTLREIIKNIVMFLFLISRYI